MLQEIITPEQFDAVYEDHYERMEAQADESREKVYNLVELFKTQPVFNPASFSVISKTGVTINVAPAVFTRTMLQYESTTPIWGVEDEYLGDECVHSLDGHWPQIVDALERDDARRLSNLKADGKPYTLWLTLAEWSTHEWCPEDGDCYWDGGHWMEVTLVRSPHSPNNILLTRINKFAWK